MAAAKGNKNALGNKGNTTDRTKYKPEYSDHVYKLCLLGATDADLASFFDVCETTINAWKKNEIEFNEALKKGKSIADANVADRLYQRAMGFEHDSEEIKTAGTEIVRVPVRKIYPPDTAAAIFWLKNRKPKLWREKTEQEHSVKGAIPITKWLTEGNDSK